MLRLIRNLVFIFFIFALGYVWGVKEIRFFEISSSSMEPTLEVGDRLLTFKITDIQRRDIVVIQSPEPFDRIPIIKRVVGLPGETVSVEDGSVYIEGRKLTERYIMDEPVYELEEVTLEGDQYFLLGDNRNRSKDSSVWGPVGRDLIRGRVIYRYWPAKRAAIFSSHPLRH